LNEYKSEAFELFRELITQWHEGVIAQISRVEVRFQQPEPEPPPPPMQYQHLDPATGENEYSFAPLTASADAGLLAAPSAVDVVDRDPKNPTTWGRVGRNEQCPCGSGKKFKHCHGQVA
jgi:preprotein translocase subunit SecA